MDYYVQPGDNYIDIYIDIDSYNTKTYNNRIIIMDNKYNKQEYINITYLPYNENLAIDYIADGEINYIGGVYKDLYNESTDYVLEPLNTRNRPIFYYNGKMYVNKNLEYGSSFLFTDNGVLKSLDSYTTETNQIIIMGIYDVHYIKYSKFNNGYYSGGTAMSTNTFDNLYRTVKDNVYPYPPNATEIIEYFFDGEIPSEEQEKIEYLAALTDKFTFKDTSNDFYKK